VAPGRFHLRCPWAHEHGPGCQQRDGVLDSSTMLFLAGAEQSPAEVAAQGDGVPLDGGVCCKHEHSQGVHRGVPFNAEIFLSYARACGAPLPDRPRYMVDEKDEDETTPLLGADLPPQERCDIDPEEASFTFDAEGEINSGDLSGKDLHELGLYPPGEMRLRTQTKAPSEAEDAASTFDELTNRVSAQLNMPKDAIVSSAAALAKSQGFRIPAPSASPAPAAAPDWFSAFLSECCIVDADASVPTPDLRGVFEIWYKANHEGSPPLAQFWKMLAEKGYESDRGSTGSFRLRRGLKLAEQSRAYQAFLQSEAAAAPPAQPTSFTEFVKKHQPSMSMFRWKEGHWLIMSGLENALTMRESLILAPPRTGRSMLATIFFPAWLMLVKGKQNVVVVCESATAAKDRHREILEKFPAIEPFVGLVLGKTVDAQPRLQFRGPYTSFTGQGFDAIIIDPPRGSDPKLASHYAVLSSRLAPGGFIATITNREGEGDFAQALINFGGGWGQRLQAHLFPDMIPTDIDRTTDTYFWQYNQGLPSYYGAKDIAAAPNSPFKKFLADCLTEEQAAKLQLIFGRMYVKGKQDTKETIYVHVGNGANGKTTLLNAVASVFGVARLGGRSISADMKLMNQMYVPFAVLEAGGDVSREWVSAMANVGAGRLATELLRSTWTKRTMLWDAVCEKPGAPVFVHVATNALEFDDHDEGTYRRMTIFEWKKAIPAAQRDPDMETKITRDPDFLIWLAEGLRRYQAGER
jgi:hypothetical protein